MDTAHIKSKIMNLLIFLIGTMKLPSSLNSFPERKQEIEKMKKVVMQLMILYIYIYNNLPQISVKVYGICFRYMLRNRLERIEFHKAD